MPERTSPAPRWSAFARSRSDAWLELFDQWWDWYPEARYQLHGAPRPFIDPDFYPGETEGVIRPDEVWRALAPWTVTPERWARFAWSPARYIEGDYEWGGEDRGLVLRGGHFEIRTRAWEAQPGVAPPPKPSHADVMRLFNQWELNYLEEYSRQGRDEAWLAQYVDAARDAALLGVTDPAELTLQERGYEAVTRRARSLYDGAVDLTGGLDEDASGAARIDARAEQLRALIAYLQADTLDAAIAAEADALRTTGYYRPLRKEDALREEERRICAAYLGDQDVRQTIAQEILYRQRASAEALRPKDAERDRLRRKGGALRAWVAAPERTAAELRGLDATAEAHWTAAPAPE